MLNEDKIIILVQILEDVEINTIESNFKQLKNWLESVLED